MNITAYCYNCVTRLSSALPALFWLCLASAGCADPSSPTRLTPSREAQATQQNQASSAILLQGFHWNSWSYSGPNWYVRLQNNAADIASLGFTHVWFPPPSNSAAREGYLPRELNLLDSSYGSETDLRAAISALSSRGVKSVADIVVNHRVGDTGYYDFQNPAWGTSAIVSNDECNCGTGAADSGYGYGSARDLDHSQSIVQTGITSWLNNRLKAVGFTGLRFDIANGYAPSYAKTYHDAFAPDFCVGEVWPTLDLNNVDANRQAIINWVDGTQGTCGAFDFTTKGLLNQALAYGEYGRLRDATGKPAGTIGWWAQKSVTFVDNHDTGPNETCNSGQRLWPVPCDKVMQGYAYVLTHPGIPSVYYPHLYDWGLKTAIKALIDVRRAQGITSTSTISIQSAQQGLYAAIINDNTAVKIGPNAWTPGAGWTLAASGTDYAVWTKSTTPCTVPITFTIANANTSLGQSLYVVGNQTALGNWTPAQGFKLTIQGSGANVPWSGTVQLPAATAIQYKYVKYNGSTAVWESNAPTTSGNRELTTAACGGSNTQNDGNFRF
ncbi:MAG TPA: glucan 1,4-alpha-maltotetraohydrolase domain-containing protein [Polyangia bacterium]|nr:glucan 1,4-alpha-maltotetraohydrolase domain-containing protein [Polyangia bacterium]